MALATLESIPSYPSALAGTPAPLLPPARPAAPDSARHRQRCRTWSSPPRTSPGLESPQRHASAGGCLNQPWPASGPCPQLRPGRAPPADLDLERRTAPRRLALAWGGHPQLWPRRMEVELPSSRASPWAPPPVPRRCLEERRLRRSPCPSVGRTASPPQRPPAGRTASWRLCRAPRGRQPSAARAPAPTGALWGAGGEAGPHQHRRAPQSACKLR
mmetsp:Transcript_104820/g.303375  ORF Transcript_104820/g.303375 Transcript_104820/m.303375 type:complete len:216 (+) Transcript_104820:368-1015(+)